MRVLGAVTDGTLNGLDLDKLLEVLVERARQLLAVDTATVLLVDRSGMQLVAKAASGLEEEVFQVLAVPGEQARFADVHVGPPISFNLGITGRRSAGVDELPGTLMVLYTDGLVERRGQDLDDNLERLRQVVTPMGPEALVAMRHLD